MPTTTQPSSNTPTCAKQPRHSVLLLSAPHPHNHPQALTGNTSFFLPVGPGPTEFPYAPELCRFIYDTLANTPGLLPPGVPAPLPPQWGPNGLDIPLDAAATWLNASIGASTQT